jgi:hypothetical protein
MVMRLARKWLGYTLAVEAPAMLLDKSMAIHVR